MEQSKGLDTLKEMSTLISNIGLDRYVKIDFYGQKTDTYFDEYLKGIEMYQYKGVLQPNGPGILVEALSASLPIITSDWKYNNKFVTIKAIL